MVQMVERQQPIKKHQHTIRKLEIIFRPVANVFEPPNDVVGAESHRAGSKRRQSGDNGGPMLLQEFFCDLEQTALPYFSLLSSFNGDFFTPSAQLHVRTRAQKCISPNLLSALHGLE